jgi:hypothetical protein
MPSTPLVLSSTYIVVEPLKPRLHDVPSTPTVMTLEVAYVLQNDVRGPKSIEYF